MERTLLTSLLTGALVLTAAPAASASGPYCGITWGSLPESSAVMEQDPVRNARAGRHACFDRFVVDLAGDAAGYDVRYVSAVGNTEGDVLPLRGEADLQVSVRAPAYDVHGNATYRPASRTEAVDVSGYRTFRQVRYVESFEAVTVFGLGVRGRLPFRVFTLDGPDGGSRLVVDVAHRW